MKYLLFQAQQRGLAGEAATIHVTSVSEMDIIEKARIIGLMLSEGYELLKLKNGEAKH